MHARGITCMQVDTELRPGFVLGAKTSDSSDYIIFNHLILNVLVHKALGAEMHDAPWLEYVRDGGGARGGRPWHP